MQGCTVRPSSRHQVFPIWEIIRAFIERALIYLFALSIVSPKSETTWHTDFCCSRDNLNEIVARYKDTVYRIAVSHMKNRDLADDIFQNTFLKLVELIYKGKQFQSEQHLKNWIIRVAINCCNDYYRSARYRNEVQLFEDRKKGDGYGSEDDDDATATENTYDPFESDNPLNEATYEAVMSLTDNLREVIHLYHYEEMSIKEIAFALSIQENAVKTRLSRARSILKSKLEGVYHG